MAEHNYVTGLYGLGICYARGNYFNRDIDKSINLITKAAEYGYIEAQWYIGVYYISIGSQQNSKDSYLNYEYGVAWLKRAAKGGSQSAIEILKKIGYTI
ncbi:MAG: hypothetical protein K2O41_03015 [Clostridia bacterium]|nr:hypothetical protein [Clostridia bacterium]